MSLGESQRLVNESFMTTIRQLQDQLAEAKAVLREVEWSGDRLYDSQPRTCPECECTEKPFHNWDGGHAPDCRLAEILEAK